MSYVDFPAVSSNFGNETNETNKTEPSTPAAYHDILGCSIQVFIEFAILRKREGEHFSTLALEIHRERETEMKWLLENSLTRKNNF